MNAPRADWDMGLARLRGVIGAEEDPEDIWLFTHEGAPASKARARWSPKNQRFYTPTKTVGAQSEMAEHFRTITNGRILRGPIAIVATFFRPNYQRIDADNLMKLVMDAATEAGIWKDDCYVTAQAAYIEMDIERPRTVVAFCLTSSSMDRTRQFTCVVCGNEFSRAGLATFKRPPKHCSRACRAKTYENDRERARCPKCGLEFVRKSAGQRYCSGACATSARRVRQPTDVQQPWPNCENCGRRVSRREYILCSDCSRKGRPLQSNLFDAGPGQRPGVHVEIEMLPGRA